MVATRHTDHGSFDHGVTVDRKIPLWGILSMVAAIAAQAALVWSGQREQAVEMRHQSEQIRELAIQVKGLAGQLATKDSKDIEQDLRLNELSRRVLALETARGGRP